MNTDLMLRYIEDTPNAITDLLDTFERVYSKDKLPAAKNIVFIGSGSSFNTACQVTFFYENYLGLNTQVYYPDTFLSIRELNLSKQNTLIVVISETGTSTYTNMALSKARKDGYKTIALTQYKNAPLANNCDYYFNFCCGEENCNAKTKGYTNNLVLLYLLGTMLANTSFDSSKLIKEIEEIKKEIKNLIESFPLWFSKHHELVRMNNILVVGAEPYLGATKEAALKMSETMLVQSSFTTAEEFPHGFHRPVNQNSNIFLINSTAYPLEKTTNYFQTKINNMILINTVDKQNGDFNIKKHKYYLEAITIGIVFQLFAYYIPTYLGLDPNRNANDDYDELIKNRLT